MKKFFAAALPFIVAPAVAAQTGSLLCTFTANPGDHATHYINDNLIPADPTHQADITYAWSEYIRATYAPTSSTPLGPCDRLTGDPAPYVKKMEQQWKAVGHTVVHVRWTYTPKPAEAQPAAPAGGNPGTTTQHRMPRPPQQATSIPASPPPPPAPVAHAPAPAPAPVAQVAAAVPATAAPAGKTYQCILDYHQGKEGGRYVGGPIVSDAPQSDLTAAWKEYIDETYHPADAHRHGGCSKLSGNPANSDKAVNAYVDNSNRLGVHTTHVDWTSAPKH